MNIKFTYYGGYAIAFFFCTWTLRIVAAPPSDGTFYPQFMWRFFCSVFGILLGCFVSVASAGTRWETFAANIVCNVAPFSFLAMCWGVAVGFRIGSQMK